MSLDVDTIVSLSTPPGLGAIAVVRLSGPQADQILGSLTNPSAELPAPRVATLMELVDPDDGSPIDRAMVRSINEVGRVMGKQTVAEFVESDRVLQVVRELGIDFAQGYAVGRPERLEDGD